MQQGGLRILVPEVAAERELPVGAGRDEPPPHRAGQRPRAEEHADLLASAVPGWQRRHRHPRVFGQHGHHGIDIVALPRGDVTLHYPAQCGVTQRAQRSLLALLRQSFVHRLVRALQGAVDGDGRRFERLGGFAGRESEHVTDYQYGALSCRQVLERRDEGEFDALALLIAGVRVGQAARQGKPVIRIGLHPHRFGHWFGRAVVGVGCGRVVDREHSLGTPLDRPEAGVRRDLVEPRAERAPALELRECPPGAQQRLLQRIFCVRRRAEHPVTVGVELGAVRTD